MAVRLAQESNAALFGESFVGQADGVAHGTAEDGAGDGVGLLHRESPELSRPHGLFLDDFRSPRVPARNNSTPGQRDSPGSDPAAGSLRLPEFLRLTK